MRSSADEYTNGWTEQTFNMGVKGCVETGTEKQINFMYSSGQIKPTATTDQVATARNMAITYVTSTCTCAQRRFMREIRFEDLQSMFGKPEYVQQVMRDCAHEALKNKT
jgi:hypothetical protein